MQYGTLLREWAEDSTKCLSTMNKLNFRLFMEFCRVVCCCVIDVTISLDMPKNVVRFITLHREVS